MRMEAGAEGTKAVKSIRKVKWGGLCIETQKFPNAINVPAWKKDAVLKPGQTYKHVMVHKFTTE